MGMAMKGDAKFASTYRGKTYYSSSADAKKMFDAEPEKYLPKYDGLCATALAMGKKMESNPKLFTVHEGATYLFSSKEAKEAFDKDPEATIAMADKQFASLEKKQH
jgi:YHS domain-containing protein